MDENVGWLSRIVQYFGPLVAAWTAALAFIVHLKKVRNAEKAAEHGRLLAEIDRLISERDVASEERDKTLDRRAEDRERWAVEKAQLMGENAELKGILQGFGEWRQFQAVRDAGRRLDERPGGNGGGEA